MQKYKCPTCGRMKGPEHRELHRLGVALPAVEKRECPICGRMFGPGHIVACRRKKERRAVLEVRQAEQRAEREEKRRDWVSGVMSEPPKGPGAVL